MRKKLLIYLSQLNQVENMPIASTLVWLSKSKNFLFDLYYDSYHQGTHFPGGDARKLEQGQLTGGMVTGDRHFEEFYFTILNFDVSVVAFKNTMFHSSLKNLQIPLMAFSDSINDFYHKVFNRLDEPIPKNIVMTGSGFERELLGLGAYLYPEIYYRRAIGVPDSISESALNELCQKGSKIFCVYANENVIDGLRNKGYDIEIVDQLGKKDDYLSISTRLAKRWENKASGWILGDPTLVLHWLPKACEENLISLYSVPLEDILSQLGDFISAKGNVVYGRPHSDRDFFTLSKLNQCIQVIDPCRPPFQAVKHVKYSWHTEQATDGFYDSEYSDEELKQFANEKRVLISLMFWSGMIREVANFYNLMDLFAITGLRCGIVLTAQSFEYMMHSPLELLVVPFQQGGVYPCVEPVLGSCGIGVGIESCLTRERLKQDLDIALKRIEQIVGDKKFIPHGWWTTMDAELERLSWWRKPKFFRFLRYSPYFQIRFHKKRKEFDGDSEQKQVERFKKRLEKAGLTKFFASYRPYEFFRAGSIKEELIETAKSVGLEYMFSKSGFHSNPEAKYMDKDFIALNYTAGQWDGWTPFETVNDVSDLKRAEKSLLRKNKPGWIVSTIDSCLWTFGGEFWKSGNKLLDIAKFCVRGGNSGKLINVKPHTVSRYARIIVGKE